MDERLNKLRGLTNALATRKRAHEIRVAQINNRIAALTIEYDQLMHAADSLHEPVPGANSHYIRRLQAILRQVQAHKQELQQMTLLQLRASADLRRSEILRDREEAEVDRLRQNRYLEQVIEVSLQRRRI